MSTAQLISSAASYVRKTLAASWETLLFLASVIIVVRNWRSHRPFSSSTYNLLAEIWSAGQDSVENWRSKLGIEPTQHLSEERHQGAGLVRHVEHKSSPGVTLIESVFDERVGLRLLDNRGSTLHTWPALYSQITPKAELIREEEIPTNDWETMVHGSALYPDGDILFNLPGLTLVRMNACGDVEWTLPSPTHHSIHLADDGNIWTLGRRYYEQPVPKFRRLRPEFRDDLVLEVSPEGKILREISLLEVLYANDLIGSVFPIGLTSSDGNPMTDLLHTNDVETLSMDMAPAFPLFEPGDALVSFRNLNLLIVFDPDSGMGEVVADRPLAAAARSRFLAGWPYFGVRQSR